MVDTYFTCMKGKDKKELSLASEAHHCESRVRDASFTLSAPAATPGRGAVTSSCSLHTDAAFMSQEFRDDAPNHWLQRNQLCSQIPTVSLSPRWGAAASSSQLQEGSRMQNELFFKQSVIWMIPDGS